MMEDFGLKQPPQFDFKKKASCSVWIKRFDRYRLASGLSEKEGDKQVSALIYAMGPDADEILSQFQRRRREKLRRSEEELRQIYLSDAQRAVRSVQILQAASGRTRICRSVRDEPLYAVRHMRVRGKKGSRDSPPAHHRSARRSTVTEALVGPRKSLWRKRSRSRVSTKRSPSRR